MQNDMLGCPVSQSFRHSHPHTHWLTTQCSRQVHKAPEPIHSWRAPWYARIFDFTYSHSTHTHTGADCWPLFCSQRMCRFKVWINFFFLRWFFAVHYMVRFIMNSIQWFESKRAKDKRSLDIRPSNVRFFFYLSRALIQIVENTKLNRATEKMNLTHRKKMRIRIKEGDKKSKERKKKKIIKYLKVQNTNRLNLSGRTKLFACYDSQQNQTTAKAK